MTVKTKEPTQSEKIHVSMIIHHPLLLFIITLYFIALWIFMYRSVVNITVNISRRHTFMILYNFNIFWSPRARSATAMMVVKTAWVTRHVKDLSMCSDNLKVDLDRRIGVAKLVQRGKTVSVKARLATNRSDSLLVDF